MQQIRIIIPKLVVKNTGILVFDRIIDVTLAIIFFDQLACNKVLTVNFASSIFLLSKGL